MATYELARLWPYAWQYCRIDIGDGKVKKDIGIGEIQFVHYLRRNELHAGCTLPNKEEVYAWWNGMDELEQQVQIAELYKIDNVADFYKKMVKLYNEGGKGKFDPKKCSAMVDEYRHYLEEQAAKKDNEDDDDD